MGQLFDYIVSQQFCQYLFGKIQKLHQNFLRDDRAAGLIPGNSFILPRFKRFVNSLSEKCCTISMRKLSTFYAQCVESFSRCKTSAKFDKSLFEFFAFLAPPLHIIKQRAVAFGRKKSRL
ncbi:MAG: hypothetical protein ACI4J8_07970 [Oscillospiraceae bacterium]